MKKWGWIRQAGFWGLWYICLWKYIEPRLVYHAFGRVLPYPEFEWGRDFAVRTVSNPGGCVQWITGLVSQSFVQSWLGAALITIVAAILSCGIGRLVSTRTLRRIASLFPALIILAAYSRYIHPLNVCLVIAFGVWAALLFRRIQPAAVSMQIAVYGCICLFVYFAAATAAWLLCAIAVIHELRQKKVVAAIGILCLTPMIMIGLGRSLSAWPWDKALTFLLPISAGWTIPCQNITLAGIHVLWLWPMIILLADLCADWISSRRRRRPASVTNKKPAAQSNRLIGWSVSAVVFACIPATAILAHHPLAAEQLRMMTLADDQRWSDVLDRARQLPANAWNVYINYEVNRALFHSGQMGEKMFAYPQSPQSLLLMVQVEPGDPELTYNLNLLVELGCANMAEHAAMELLEVKGNCPFLLEQLARIYLVKHSPDTAGVFLRKLRSIPSYRRRAETLLEMVNSDPQMNNQEEILRLRAYISDEDIVTFDLDAQSLFGNLLNHNPDNRAAYEYRMAFYLLTQQVDKVAANLEGLRRFGLTQLPRHYAEALAIHRARGGQPVSLGPFELPRQIEKEAQSFLQTYNGLKGDRALAMRTLAKSYGNSYFYYYTFGISGVQE